MQSNSRLDRTDTCRAEIARRSPQLRSVRPFRAAAVVIAIYADEPHHVVFVERAAHLRDHPGQIGFPGGSADAADGDDRALTALRELDEELGIPPHKVTLVARLPDVQQRVNTFIVTPFVGILEAHTRLTIDPAETAAVFTVPLNDILAPGAVHPGNETVGERTVRTWIFNYGERHVWGLTARILRDFRVAWNVPASPARAAVERLLNGPANARVDAPG